MEAGKKITFYIMSFKGYQVLKAVISKLGTGIIDKVISATDKGVSEDYFKEIQKLCNTNNIPFFKNTENAEPGPGYSIVISWRWMIKNNPRLIVLHDGLLPKYRGFAPLVSSLINGEKKIGVTALMGATEFDKGDILLQDSIDVTYPLKIEKAISLLSQIYCTLTLKIIEAVTGDKSLPVTPQNDREASYSLWLDEQDYRINWNRSAGEIARFIDAVGYPYSGAATFLEDMKVRIFESEVIEDVLIMNRVPGKVIFMQEGVPTVVCGQGLLKLIDIRDNTNKTMLPFNKFRLRFH